jgi:anti-sigma-K factor RsiG
VELFPDLATLTEVGLADLIGSLEREEDAISFRRRVLHGRIDILRQEHVERVRRQVAAGALPDHGSEVHVRPLYEGSGEVPPEHELEPMPDFATLSDDALRSMIRDLEREEDDISLRRRFLHGQIEILRAARYARLRDGSVEVSDLARVLTHRVPEQTDRQA